MNLNKLMDIVLLKTSNWTKAEGKIIFNKNLVSNIASKNINNIYNIYGRVGSRKNSSEYYTHLKINLEKENLEQCKCSCDAFTENYKYNKKFLCPHLIATMFGFYNLASKKLENKKIENDELNNDNQRIIQKLMHKENLEDKLNVKVKLNHIKNQSSEYYEAEFRIGKNNNTILLRDLEDFLNKKRQNKRVVFTSEFIYNPEKNYFSEEDEMLFDYIEEYINVNRYSNNFFILNKKTLRILPTNLKSFLKIINGKTITFKYNYIEYNTQILEEDLPINFTLKNIKNKFVLTTRKVLPLPIDNNKSVYFYEGDIYIPSKKQIEFYNPFYEEFKNHVEIQFKNEFETLNNLLTILKNVSKEIRMHESMKEYTSNLLNVSFYLNKINEKITCSVILKYHDESIDLIKDNNKKILVDRDLRKEEKIKNYLSKYNFIKRNDNFEFVGDDKTLYEFLKNGKKELKLLGDIFLNNEFQNVKLYDSSLVDVNISETDKGIILNYDFPYIDNEYYADILKAFKNNNKFFKTKSNIFIDFSDDKMQSFFKLIRNVSDNFHETNNIKIENNKIYYIDELIKKNNIEYIKGKKILENVCKKLIELKNVEYEEPQNLNGKLRNYQLTGYRWMRNLAYMGLGGILGDEMGLGKTIQTISFILSQKKSKTLLIVPTSLVYNWKNEFEKFAPSLNIGIVHGSLEERIKILKNREEYEVLLTTYGTLRNDSDLYEEIDFDYCIIDEGQNIKNIKSQTTMKVKNINAKVKFVLTGTFIENNLMELWSIFDFILPGHLEDQETFNDKFVINYKENIDELKSLIRPFILRREKLEVLKELPDKIEKKFLIEMNKEQMDIYESYRKEIKEKMKNNKEDKITIFSYLTKLRQLCLDPKILIDNYIGGSAKIDIAMDMINDAVNKDKKILLFSQFTTVLKNISKMLNDSEIDYLYLDGETNASKRVDLVNKFNENNNIKVFLISLKAGGTGLNLTSANIVIHFDPWWNPAIEDQATDRAHRIGQKNIVEVIKLISENTIEEKIIKLQNDKKDLINTVMNGDLKDSKLMDKLSNEELIELFN